MYKKFLYVHFALAAVMLVAIWAELVHFLYVYSDMPETIGMHFGSNGDFDVHAEKYYGFYPYLMGTLIIGALLVADRFILRLKVGASYDPKGESMVRASVLLFTNGIKAYTCLFFLEWSDAVIHQHGTKGRVNNIGAYLFLVYLAAALILSTYAKLKHKQKGEDTAKTDTHRLVRLYCIMISICQIVVSIVIWERYPGGNETTDPFAKIYFADLGTYAPKWLHLIPVMISFAAAFASHMAVKRFIAKGRTLSAAAADFAGAYITTVCFLRAIVVPEESVAAMCFEMLIIFALLAAEKYVKYRIKKRRESKNDSLPGE